VKPKPKPRGSGRTTAAAGREWADGGEAEGIEELGLKAAGSSSVSSTLEADAGEGRGGGGVQGELVELGKKLWWGFRTCS
jgi:hypothetical protein